MCINQNSVYVYVRQIVQSLQVKLPVPAEKKYLKKSF